MKRLKILISLTLMMLMCGCEITMEKVTSEVSETETEFNGYLDEETIYDILVTELAQGKSVIEFDKVIDVDVLNAIITRIEHEYPEYYWLSKTRTITTSNRYTTVDFNTVEILNEEQTKAEFQVLEAAADEIISAMPAGLDDYGKILFIHDYLAENVVYATDKVGIETEGLWDTAYGSLVQGYAVCGGYADGFTYLMKRLGIESGVVYGEVSDENGNQTGHAWNYVYLNNMYYWLDLTWDDTDDENNPVTHFYFLIDDRHMNKNRVLRKNQYFVPACYSMDENFYVRNDSYITYYTAEAVGLAVLSSPYDDKIELMFADKLSYDTAVKDLLENGKLWELPECDGISDSVSYSLNDDMYAICINTGA